MASSLGIWHGSWGYIAVTVLLAVLATLAVALRFGSRRIVTGGNGGGGGVCVHHADDWLALAALFVHHGFAATVIASFVRDGLGFDAKRLMAADSRAAMELQKLTFIGTILYGIGLTCIRLSLIIFYFRLFPTKVVRRGGYVLAVACLLWFVAVEALNLATCKPISYQWDQSTTGGQCRNAPAGDVVPGAFNVALDAAVVGLPVYEVMKLNLAREKKGIVFVVFLIGGLATAVSIARLISIALYHRFDKSKGDGTGAISALLSGTTAFEVYLGLLGASLPTVLPACHKLLNWPAYALDRDSSSDEDADVDEDAPIPRHRTGFTNRPSKNKKSHHHHHHQSHSAYTMGGATPALSRTALRESDDEERPFNKRLDDVHVLVPPKERGEFWTDISAQPPAAAAEVGIPLSGIRVQRDVTWNSES